MRSDESERNIVGGRVNPFGLVVGISAAGLCATLVVFGFFVVSGHDSTIRLRGDWRIELDPDTVNTRLVIFRSISGTFYRGGILSMGQSANGPTVEGWGDRMGIYYRKVQWPGGRSDITLSFRAAYLLLLFGLLPAIWCCRRLTRSGPAGFPIEPVSGKKSSDITP